MKLTVLGSGSPEPHLRRASSGYLLDVAGQKILIDCGGGVFDRLLQAGFLPTDIDALFFTHLHSDHMIDYPRLVHARWDMGGTDLPVFGPSPIDQITERYFGKNGALAYDLVARTEFQGSQQVWLDRGGTLPRAWPSPAVMEIAAGYVHAPDGWVLRAFEVPHAQPQLTCLGFRIECEGKCFVFSGDAGLCRSLEDASEGADLLLHWCYRNEGEVLHEEIDDLAPWPSQIGEVATRAGVKRVLLTHFRAHMDDEAGHTAALSGIRRTFDGPAEIVEDLRSYSI